MTSKKTGGPIAIDDEVNVRELRKDVEAVKKGLIAGGIKDFEHVDRGVLKKAA